MILVVTVIYLGVTSLFVMSLALSAARPMPTRNDRKHKRSNRRQTQFSKPVVIESPTASGKTI